MTAVELKQEIITRINSIDDEDTLQGILQTVELEQRIGKVYILSSEEEEMIKQRTEEIDNGNFIDHEEVVKRMGEWRKR